MFSRKELATYVAVAVTLSGLHLLQAEDQKWAAEHVRCVVVDVDKPCISAAQLSPTQVGLENHWPVFARTITQEADGRLTKRYVVWGLSPKVPPVFYRGPASSEDAAIFKKMTERL